MPAGSGTAPRAGEHDGSSTQRRGPETLARLHSQTAPVLRFLRRQGIPYWVERGQPVTTLEAINAKLLASGEQEIFEFGQKAQAAGR